MDTKIQKTLKKRRVISQKECEINLKGVMTSFFSAFSKAKKLYNQQIILTPPDSRCRGFAASLLNSKMIECFQAEFPENWKFLKYRRFALYINGYTVFIKKLDRYGMPMNVRTKNNEYLNNQLQLSLFETEETSSPVLYFGYSEGDLGAITNPRLVYIDEGKVKWSIVKADTKQRTDEKSTARQIEPTVAKLKSAVHKKAVNE